MPRSLAFLLALAPVLAALPAAGQSDALPPPPLDPAIVAAIGGISAANLRADDQRLVAFGTRSTFSDAAPAGRGVVAAREWIASRFREYARASGGRMTVAFDGYTQPKDPAHRAPREVVVTSVIATLRGDDPTGRVVVISSHYDSRNSDNDDGVHDAPGADDNGSGTATVLEAARVLAAMPLHATVVFACFDGEEQGLWGSGHYAKTLHDAHVPVEADLNNDIIGASVGDDGVKRDGTIRIFSEAVPAGANVRLLNALGAENDSPSRELARFVKWNSDAYPAGLSGTLVFRADRFLRGGDHESFNAQGYPAIRFTEPVETFNHQHQNVRVENGVQYGDLMRYMDFDYLAKVARYNVASLAALAAAPAPPVAQIVTAALTNQTTLRWAAVPGATRYEIVRRLTTEPVWSHVEDAGAVTTVTLPYSKDQWQFGVRSVDARGHRSPAAYPEPARS